MSADNASSGSARILRETLARWLNKTDWSIGELHRLLQGDDWPPVGGDEEPHSHFLQALETLGPDYRVELAERLAKVLDEAPEETLPGNRPQQMLYNLLRLCSELYRPQTLSAPLRRMWGRGKLAGDWRGADLRDRLRSALMLNQGDSTMKPVWQAMVEGKPHDFLSGNVAQGFYGLLLMKPIDGVRPDLAALGSAIGKVAEHLDGAGYARNLLLKQFLDRLCAAYPNQNWDADFLNLAGRHDWRPWTITSLPSIAVRSNGNALVLSSVGKGIEKAFGCKVERMMFKGLIAEVAIGGSEEAGDLLSAFGRETRIAWQEMKVLAVLPWFKATRNAIVYLKNGQPRGGGLQALTIADNEFRLHDWPVISNTS